MTMADNSLPPSPDTFKDTENEDSPLTYSMSSSSHALSAIKKTLYYGFPTPPQSPQRLCTYPGVASTGSSVVRRRLKRARTTPLTPSAWSTHTEPQSPLSTGFHVTLVIETKFGPPPHPAPSAPLPPIPCAPRVPFTTPGQERNRHSSYELCDKLWLLEKQQRKKDAKNE